MCGQFALSDSFAWGRFRKQLSFDDLFDEDEVRLRYSQALRPRDLRYHI
ncbi:hypothetical protein [Algicola sagamiensis]|nr:hypothetical protein [Algicola sagamiensis]